MVEGDLGQGVPALRRGLARLALVLVQAAAENQAVAGAGEGHVEEAQRLVAAGLFAQLAGGFGRLAIGLLAGAPQKGAV
ncbi:MAG: hypothetical protein KY433_12985, partial [Actinobacteria bacterium]|nr:hypothetical protein [Actinomycetota bacterium]